MAPWTPLSWKSEKRNEETLYVTHGAAPGLVWLVNYSQYCRGIKRPGTALPNSLKVREIHIEKAGSVVYKGYNRFIPAALLELAEQGIKDGYKVYIRGLEHWVEHTPPLEFVRAVNGVNKYFVNDYPNPSYLGKPAKHILRRKAKHEILKDAIDTTALQADRSTKTTLVVLVAELIQIAAFYKADIDLNRFDSALTSLFGASNWKQFYRMGKKRRYAEDMRISEVDSIFMKLVPGPRPEPEPVLPVIPAREESPTPAQEAHQQPAEGPVSITPVQSPPEPPSPLQRTPEEMLELAKATRERDRLLESTDPATIDIQAAARKKHEEEARAAEAAAEALLAAYTTPPPKKYSDLEDIEDNFGLDESEPETSKDAEAKIKARRDLANKLIEERNFPKEFLENYENNRFKRRAPTPPATTWYEMGYMTHQHQLEHLIKTYPDTYEEHLKFTEDNKYLVGYDPASVLKRIAEERAISKAKAEEENKKRIAYEAERDERRKRLGIQNILD